VSPSTVHPFTARIPFPYQNPSCNTVWLFSLKKEATYSFELEFIWETTRRHIAAVVRISDLAINPLNSELNPICHLLALLGAHHILHVSKIRVKSHASYIYRTGVPLPSRCCILYIFISTNISTEYFKHAAHSPFFSSKCRLFHNTIFFGYCIIHIFHTGCAKV
jgi:hypothetical protein